MAAIVMLRDHDSPVRTLRTGERVDDISADEMAWLVECEAAEWADATTAQSRAKKVTRKKKAT
jgi:hypothetical protein